MPVGGDSNEVNPNCGQLPPTTTSRKIRVKKSLDMWPLKGDMEEKIVLELEGFDNDGPPLVEPTTNEIGMCCILGFVDN